MPHEQKEESLDTFAYHPGFIRRRKAKETSHAVQAKTLNDEWDDEEWDGMNDDDGREDVRHETK